MPVLKDKKLIFIHIPKTGGTSIEIFFDMLHTEALCYTGWDIDQSTFPAHLKIRLGEHPKKHYEPQHYNPELLKLLIPDYDQYFKFTFVRHPYERMISEFYYSRKWTLRAPHSFSPIEFDQWCKSYLAVIDHSHKEPQSFYLNDDIQFIGRFEQIEQDLKKLILLLSQKDPHFKELQDKTLPFTNHTGMPKAKLLDRLLPATKAYLFNYYREDFERLGYDPLLESPIYPSAQSEPTNAVKMSSPHESVVSVLITFYNYKEYIDNCVQSVLSSNLKNVSLEIVVVDDASDPEHAVVLEQLCAPHPEIKIIRNPANMGLARSRNIGVHACSGEYIFILDADNWIHPDCLQCHVDELQSHPEAVACYAPIREVDGKGKPMDGFRSHFPFSIERLQGGNYIDAMALFRKQSLLDLGLYDEKLSFWGWEDFDLWLKIAHFGLKVQFIASEPLSYYRVHYGSMTELVSSSLQNPISVYLIEKYKLFGPLTINSHDIIKAHFVDEYYAQLFYVPAESEPYSATMLHFKEENSLRIYHLKKEAFLCFTLPADTFIQKLRFDPLNHFVQITLHKLQFFYQGGPLSPDFQLHSNALIQHDNIYRFQTTDPQIFLEFHGDEGVLVDRVEISLTYDSIELNPTSAPVTEPASAELGLPNVSLNESDTGLAVANSADYETKEAILLDTNEENIRSSSSIHPKFWVTKILNKLLP